MVESMSYEWVIARYPANSKNGQFALLSANAGVGYFLQNKSRNKTDDVIVAFRRPLDGKPRSSNLIVANPEQEAKLEDLYYARNPHLKKIGD